MILSYFTAAAAFILGLGGLVFIHELGHFLAARFVGARVETFSIGFGQRLFGFKRGDTDYRVSLIPLGGYVRITGQEGFDDLEGKDYELASKSILQRFLVFFAGPGMNYFFAILVFAAFAMIGVQRPLYLTDLPVVGHVMENSAAAKVGIEPGDRILSVGHREVNDWEEALHAFVTESDTTLRLTVARGEAYKHFYLKRADNPPSMPFPGISNDLAPVIGDVIPGTPAAAAGIQEGDTITAINGEAIDSFYDLPAYIAEHGPKPLELSILRNEENLSITVTPVVQPPSDRPLIGIAVDQPSATKRYALFEAVGRGATRTAEVNLLMVMGLGQMFQSSEGLNQVSGPVGIARMASDQASQGVRDYFGFLAILSINLAFLNLLPIPVLDGGHILFLGIEALVGREWALKLKLPAIQAGLLFLLVLMVFAVFNDFRMLIFGGGPFGN